MSYFTQKANILRNACVGDEGTMSLRENEIRAVFSLPFLSLRGYKESLIWPEYG